MQNVVKYLFPLQQGKRYFTTFCMVECVKTVINVTFYHAERSEVSLPLL